MRHFLNEEEIKGLVDLGVIDDDPFFYMTGIVDDGFLMDLLPDTINWYNQECVLKIDYVGKLKRWTVKYSYILGDTEVDLFGVVEDSLVYALARTAAILVEDYHIYFNCETK